MTKPALPYTAASLVVSPLACLPRMPACLAAFFVFLVLFSSCATVFNRSLQPIQISTDPQIRSVSVPAAIFVDSDSRDQRRLPLLAVAVPKTYWVRRSNESLTVTYHPDSTATERKTVFRPHHSLAWWLNIPGNYGLGMLIDHDNMRRYSYPAWTYLELDDSVIRVRRFPPIPKGSIRLSLAWHLINDFSIRSPRGPYHTNGIFGLAVSGEYFYKKDRYISLSAGAASSAAPVDRFGKGYIQFADNLYTNIRANRVIGSFDIGYGISLSQPVWRQNTLGDTVNLDRSFKNTVLGASLSAQYRIANTFRIGVLYQPGILSANLSPALHYQHFISLNFVWKLILPSHQKPG